MFDGWWYPAAVEKAELLAVMLLAAGLSGACLGAWIYSLGLRHQRRKEGGWPTTTVAPTVDGAPASVGSSRETGGNGEDGEDDGDRLERLERAQKMLQGRLNRLAPPRKGTGEPSEEPEIVAPAASQGPPIMTRSAILAEYHRRRGR